MPTDGAIAGAFYSNDQTPLATEDFDRYRKSAEDFADTLVTNAGVLDGLIAPLTPACAARTAACAEAFFTQYGGRLYRRPLNTDELAEYGALYAWAVTPATDNQFITAGSGPCV